MGPLTMLSGSNSSWDRNTLRRFRETLACMEKGCRTIYTLLVTFKCSLFCATHTLYRYYAVLIPPWIHCIVAWIVIELSFPNPQEIWVMSGTPIHHNWDYFTRTALNTQELQGPFQRWPNFPQWSFSTQGNVISPPRASFCTETPVNDSSLTSTMLLMTIGSMFSGNLRMLNNARETKAFWASKMLFLSIMTYTANVDRATWNKM